MSTTSEHSHGNCARTAFVPLLTFHWARKIPLRRGNVLVFVNFNDGSEPHKADVYPTGADVEPCVPVKPTSSGSWGAAVCGS